MRGTGWIPFVAAMAIFIIVVGYPLIAAVSIAATSSDSRAAGIDLWGVTSTTVLWSAAVAAGAMVVGWWPARLLSAVRSARFRTVIAVLCVFPILLPEYVVYWGWWQAWPVDSWIHEWAVRQDRINLANGDGAWRMEFLRGATVWLGLVCWSWPISAWVLASSTSIRGQEDLLALDTRSALRQMLLRLRAEWRAILTSAAIVFIVIFNSTTSFDLAQVHTLGYELRAMQSEGATMREVLYASGPGMAVACAGAITMMLLLRGWRQNEIEVARAGRATVASVLVGLVMIIATVAIPLVLVLRQSIDSRTFEELRAGYQRAAINTAAAALGAGVCAAVITAGMAAAFADSRRIVRAVATTAGGLWLVVGAAPAAAIAAGLESAYNISFPGEFLGLDSNSPIRFDEGIYRGPLIMVFGYLARFGFVAVLVGWWLAQREEKSLRALRELDGAGTLRGLAGAWRGQWLAAAGCALAIVTIISLGEVSLTAMIQPAGFDAVSAILLNNMHYQRSEMVALMGRILIGLAAIVAVVVVSTGMFRLRRPSAAVTARAWLLLFMLATSSLVGCEESGSVVASTPSHVRRTFGEAGNSIGQFSYPRAMDVDPARGLLYIIDRSGRVQRFGVDGEVQKQWLLPEYANGYPTGVTIGPDGRIYIADTHAHCVSIFDAEGNLENQFGEHGTGPGQFIFPSDVAFGPDGRIYVSEFGDNDRIQVFDADYQVHFEFGAFGSAPGEFNRPQSMSFNATGTELFVADACNHRIQVFDPAGNLLRIIGSAGTEVGKFRYPYGVVALENDRIMVTEFGNHRIQFLTADGVPRSVLGKPGEGDGELMAPWTSAATADEIFVLDSRNSRVQVFDRQQ